MILGEECARAKPFPDPYLEGLKFLGIAPSEALVFEDSLSGSFASPSATGTLWLHFRFQQMAAQSLLPGHSPTAVPFAGIGGGVAADIPVVGITTTQAPERLQAAGCKWIIDDYTALAKHCQNLKS